MSIKGVCEGVAGNAIYNALALLVSGGGAAWVARAQKLCENIADTRTEAIMTILAFLVGFFAMLAFLMWCRYKLARDLAERDLGIKLRPVQLGASPQYDASTGQVFCTACRASGKPNVAMTLDHCPSMNETLFRCPCGHTEHAHGKVSMVSTKDNKGFESVTEEYSKDEIPVPTFMVV